MGKAIAKLYDFVEDKAGRTGKVELAKRTGIPSVLAEGTPDSPENLEKFRTAVKEIVGSLPPGV